MPISAEQFDRLPDLSQADAEALLRDLWASPEAAGRALALLVERGQVEVKTGPLGERYYRAK